VYPYVVRRVPRSRGDFATIASTALASPSAEGTDLPLAIERYVQFVRVAGALPAKQFFPPTRVRLDCSIATSRGDSQRRESKASNHRCLVALSAIDTQRRIPAAMGVRASCAGLRGAAVSAWQITRSVDVRNLFRYGPCRPVVVHRDGRRVADLYRLQRTVPRFERNRTSRRLRLEKRTNVSANGSAMKRSPYSRTTRSDS